MPITNSPQVFIGFRNESTKTSTKNVHTSLHVQIDFLGLVLDFTLVA